MSTAIIYGAIGIIALLSFFKLMHGGADENSFFVLLDRFTAGRILNWAIILGAVCFIVWRLYEAFTDPYHTGHHIKAILLRTGGAFSSGADAFIAISVLQALFNRHKAPVTGDPIQQRSFVNELFQSHWGHILVIIIGVIGLLTAAVLILYGLSARFMEKLRADDFSKGTKHVLRIIAYAGYLSRGVIVGIIGFFFIKAAIKDNSTYVVNTDKAFDFIGDHVGHLWFILISIGTICYGVYMFILALHYDVRSGKR